MSVEIGGTPEQPTFECATCDNEIVLSPDYGQLIHHPTRDWFDYLLMQCPADDCGVHTLLFIRDAPYYVYKPFLPTVYECNEEPDEIIQEMFKEAYDIVDLTYHKLAPNEEVELRNFHSQLEGVEPFDLG